MSSMLESSRVCTLRRNSGVPLGQAEVHLELETRGPEHIGEILAGLRDAGYGASVLH